MTVFYICFCFFVLKKIPFGFPFETTRLEGVLFLIWLLPICSLIINFASSNDSYLTSFLFCNKPISYLRRISYGIYLYHFVVYYFLDTYIFLRFSIKHDVVIIFAKIILTVIFSAISWEFIEKRILAFKGSISYKTIP
jgi:peptidoglycan/LPS O-acetylase OafA/YrhL